MNVSFVFFIFIFFFSTLVFGSIVDIAKHAAIAAVNSYGGPVGISVLVVYHLAIKHSNGFISKNKANSYNIYHRSKDLTEERLVPSPTCPITPTESQPLPEGNTLFDQPLTFYTATFGIFILNIFTIGCQVFIIRLARRANKKRDQEDDVKKHQKMLVEGHEDHILMMLAMDNVYQETLVVAEIEMATQSTSNRRTNRMLDATQEMLKISIDTLPDLKEPWASLLKEMVTKQPKPGKRNIVQATKAS